MSEWISVKDRLPAITMAKGTMSEPMLVCYADGSKDLARLNQHGANFFWRSGIDWKITHGVTHWMPLPEPPASEGVKGGEQNGK